MSWTNQNTKRILRKFFIFVNQSNKLLSFSRKLVSKKKMPRHRPLADIHRCVCGKHIRPLERHCCKCRRCYRQFHESCVNDVNGKTDQSTSKDEWLCFYCDRGTPSSSEEQLTDHCFEVSSNLFLSLENGGCYRNGGRKKDGDQLLCTLNKKTDSDVTRRRQTRRARNDLADTKVVSVYHPDYISGHRVEITSGVSAALYEIITHGCFGILGPDGDTSGFSCWHRVEDIAFASQGVLAAIADSIKPRCEVSLQSIMYSKVQETAVVQNAESTWLSLIYIGRFANVAPASAPIGGALNLEFGQGSEEENDVVKQAYVISNAGHAFTFKKKDAMKITVTTDAGAGHHEILWLAWCDEDPGAN
jgi:hypothetical protein